MKITEVVNLNTCFEVKHYLLNKLGRLEDSSVSQEERNEIKQELVDNEEDILICSFKNQSIHCLYQQVKSLL